LPVDRHRNEASLGKIAEDRFALSRECYCALVVRPGIAQFRFVNLASPRRARCS
jgi:hypothetical protein